MDPTEIEAKAKEILSGLLSAKDKQAAPAATGGTSSWWLWLVVVLLGVGASLWVWWAKYQLSEAADELAKLKTEKELAELAQNRRAVSDLVRAAADESGTWARHAELLEKRVEEKKLVVAAVDARVASAKAAVDNVSTWRELAALAAENKK